jgi:muramoyltetrapeptide carboxypeptidase
VKLAVPVGLSPGDVISVVAPSSPPALDELWQGLAWLRTRYRIQMSSGLLERDGFLAGGDERRFVELAAAMRDPLSKAVIVARGGHGAMRIVDRLPWGEFAHRPKWLVGFSDTTALHAMAWQAGVASIHGPNVTGLGRGPAPRTRSAFLLAIERPGAGSLWRGLRVIREGTATGPIAGGNLTVIHAMAAARRLTLPEGCILAFEDVSEAPYRIDRMLTSLALGGHLARAAALVFGDFVRCPLGPEGLSVDDVLEERTGRLGVPVVAGAPFGHGSTNDAFVLGSRARICGDQVTIDGAA